MYDLLYVVIYKVRACVYYYYRYNIIEYYTIRYLLFYLLQATQTLLFDNDTYV